MQETKASHLSSNICVRSLFNINGDNKQCQDAVRFNISIQGNDIMYIYFLGNGTNFHARELAQEQISDIHTWVSDREILLICR